jgi:type IV pilus biogenesis protein CpaD/CtpE
MVVRFLLLAVLAAAVTASLSGCATSIDVPREVKVPTPVACIDQAKVPAKPAVRSESDLAAMDRYRRTLASWADRLKLVAYAAELEAIVEGCSRIPP